MRPNEGKGIMRLKQAQANQSVGKTIQIIETMAYAKTPLRLCDLAHSVDMPPSTVLRMLTALVNAGYVYQEQAETRRYALTLRFLHIGQMAANCISLRDIAHPYLLHASELTGEAGCIAVQEGSHVRYIDVTEGVGNLLTIRQQIGGTGRMHCSGSGKLFLSQYDLPALDRFIKEEGLPELTSHTISTRDGLIRELDRCRALGYAMDDEECEQGIRCVAAPIRDASGRIIAAMSISGPITRITLSRCTTCKTSFDREETAV